MEGPGDWMSGFLDNWIVHVAAFLQPKLSGSRFHSALSPSFFDLLIARVSNQEKKMRGSSQSLQTAFGPEEPEAKNGTATFYLLTTCPNG